MLTYLYLFIKKKNQSATVEGRNITQGFRVGENASLSILPRVIKSIAWLFSFDGTFLA